MKMLKKLCILILLVFSLMSEFTLSANKMKNENNAFLQAETEKKVLSTKSDSSIQANIQLSTAVASTATSLPIVGNHKLEDSLTEEEKYELERANAMADFIF